MTRTTRKNVEGVFRWLCVALAKPCALDIDNYQEKLECGAWGLDFSAPNGGYMVVAFLRGGGEDTPFGCERRSAGEMYSALHFALRALDIKAATPPKAKR